jgi:predicted esterase
MSTGCAAAIVGVPLGAVNLRRNGTSSGDSLPYSMAIAAFLAATLLSPLLAAEEKGREPTGTLPATLEVPGQAQAFYYAPKSKVGRKPVVVWVHGRGGDPQADCKKWSQIVRNYGWLLCPSGPEDRGAGARGWNNNWVQAKTTIAAALTALTAKYNKRVRSKGHALIGFSEGAFVAMNLGVRDPDTFNRWLILAANDEYWGGSGLEELKKHQGKLRRVYLLTGQKDEVVDSTKRVFESMEKEKVKVRLWTPQEIGHEVPADRMHTFYHKPMAWLMAAK